ncbi:TlpA disulfide reductase family protein [uncultured Alistipes sp.]|uniref:peroxiredoxin family protein n=1 Tax=uncultured Alistipes sp. TaxID=538949 RepID=UPI0025D819B8|nr:TlpA disulfide reductase family protein [uncultured Alistipes sp.]
MKKLFCMAFALTMAFVASAQQLPDVRVENAEGKTISTRELIGGKPLIISFWSLACKPCIQELNAINDQLDEWREQADFEVIAVSVDDVRMKAAAKAKSRSFGWDFICIFDGNQTLKRAMNVSLTPQSFVLDKEGRIVFSHSGYTPGSEQLLLDKILELNK